MKYFVMKFNIRYLYTFVQNYVINVQMTEEAIDINVFSNRG